MHRERQPLILVIDREIDTLTSLYSVLDGEGYLVATAHPSVDALKYVAGHKPDLVIVGKEGGDLSGIDLVGRIREISPDTRIVLLAPSGARRGRADQLLFKPYTRTEVLEKVGPLLPAVQR
ncbi:MAG TPA: response regulator [Planctomycetota bacterium]|nr:response regulator [Planctomycetota bacterium]